MNKGCEVAKWHSNLILTNDSFNDLLNCIFESRHLIIKARRLLQFNLTAQLAIVISCLFLISIWERTFIVPQYLFVSYWFINVLVLFGLGMDEPNMKEMKFG